MRYAAIALLAMSMASCSVRREVTRDHYEASEITGSSVRYDSSAWNRLLQESLDRHVEITRWSDPDASGAQHKIETITIRENRKTESSEESSSISQEKDTSNVSVVVKDHTEKKTDARSGLSALPYMQIAIILFAALAAVIYSKKTLK